MRKISLLLFLLIVLPFAGAQQKVTVQANIAHKNGKPVTVEPGTLQLLENGFPVEKLELRAISSDAVSFAVVVDMSGSTRNKIQHMRDYALTAFQLLGANGPGILCLYADRVACSPDSLTSDEARKTLQRTNPAGGSGLYDALWKAMEALEGRAAADQVKIIVVLSDGDNTLGTTQLEDVIRKATRSQTVIIPVGLLDPDKRKQRMGLLREIATSTGTRPILLDEPGNVKTYLENILGSQYSLIYESKLSASAERKLSLGSKVTDVAIVIAQQ